MLFQRFIQLAREALASSSLAGTRLASAAVAIFNVFKEAYTSFHRARASQAAAGMAYYAIFSLFPLLVLIIILGSFFVDSEAVYQRVMEMTGAVIPVSNGLIEQNIQQVLRLRGAVGLLGLVGLLWSATSVFTALIYNINLAWPEMGEMNFFKKRLMALQMVGALFGLLFLSVSIPALVEILPRISVPVIDRIPFYETRLWELSSRTLPLLFPFLMFLAFYRWIPKARVGWLPAVWSALAAALTWRAATNAFTWYLRVGLGRYELVYGSLGAVVALLFLIYISSWITLFGAHLCAAICHAQASEAEQQPSC